MPNYKLTFFLCLLLSFRAKNISAQKIEWDADTTLKVTDFRMKPPQHQLRQSVYPLFFIRYDKVESFGLFEDRTKWKVTTYFMSQSSWIEEGGKTASLLNFSNLSFDLFEYGSRLMRKYFLENPALTDADADDFHDKTFDLIKDMQSEYGRVSSYGSNPKAQQEWAIRVDSLLSGLTD